MPKKKKEIYIYIKINFGELYKWNKKKIIIGPKKKIA